MCVSIYIAICWSPSHSSVLATGGGTNDRCIKLWNISSGMLLKSINAESQVSGLIWSENYREILSSHGFTKNQLALWKYPEMTQVRIYAPFSTYCVLTLAIVLTCNAIIFVI